MMPGTVLGGRYRLEDLLDDIDGARFWRATDTVLARSVAVHAIDESDPRVEGMLEAARVSATVTDPHLLRVLDADIRDGKAWVINEWGTGQSLDVMVSRGVLPPDRAAWLVREVASAMAVAHSADLAHGRLAPENVMVTESGTVRLIGFAVDAALQRGRLRSGNYPEADEKQADVFDLAGLLYAGLVGCWPGASGSVVKPAPRDAHGPLRPRQVRAGVPRPLDAICDRMLARPLPNRTAHQLAAVLTEYIGELAVADPAVLPVSTTALPVTDSSLADLDSAVGPSVAASRGTGTVPHPALDDHAPTPGPAAPDAGPEPTAIFAAADPASVDAAPDEPDTDALDSDDLSPEDVPWDEEPGSATSEEAPLAAAGADDGSTTVPPTRLDSGLDSGAGSGPDLDETVVAVPGLGEPPATGAHAGAGPGDQRGFQRLGDDPDATQLRAHASTEQTGTHSRGTSPEDDTEWHQPRPEAPTPAPSLEPLPERPLFAPVGTRRTPKGSAPRSETSDWGTNEGLLSGTGTGSVPAQREPDWPFGSDPEEERDDWEERTSRHWLRLPLVILLLAAVAAVVAVIFTIGGGKDTKSPGATGSPSPSASSTAPTRGQPVKIVAVKDLDPFGSPPEENPAEAKNAIDGNPATTWQTLTYRGRPDLGGLKPGVGLMVDLGSIQNVGSVAVNLVGTPTNLVLYAAPTSSGAPSGIEGLTKIASRKQAGTQVVLKPTSPVRTRYVVVWLTSLPPVSGGFRGEISDIAVRS